MQVLILGGTSLTGPYVARRLHGAGHQVTVFHRGTHEPELPEGIAHIHGDLAHPPHELRDATPDVVIHMWAMAAAQARAFLEDFRGSAGRAVVISSCDVYRAYGKLQRLETGAPDATPLAESAPLRESRFPYRGKPMPPDCPGDYDKILVEETLRAQSELPVTILRFPAVYGRNDSHRFRPWVQPMLAGAPELRLQDGFAAWRWTHGFAEDVAGAVVLAATDDRAAGQTYNVGEAVTSTWIERLKQWGRVAGWKGQILTVPPGDLPEAQRMPHDFRHHLEIDTSRIRRELGYREVVRPEDAIGRTLDWERT